MNILVTLLEGAISKVSLGWVDRLCNATATRYPLVWHSHVLRLCWICFVVAIVAIPAAVWLGATHQELSDVRQAQWETLASDYLSDFAGSSVFSYALLLALGAVWAGSQLRQPAVPQSTRVFFTISALNTCGALVISALFLSFRACLMAPAGLSYIESDFHNQRWVFASTPLFGVFMGVWLTVRGGLRRGSKPCRGRPGLMARFDTWVAAKQPSLWITGIHRDVALGSVLLVPLLCFMRGEHRHASVTLCAFAIPMIWVHRPWPKEIVNTSKRSYWGLIAWTEAFLLVVPTALASIGHCWLWTSGSDAAVYIIVGQYFVILAVLRAHIGLVKAWGFVLLLNSLLLVAIFAKQTSTHWARTLLVFAFSLCIALGVDAYRHRNDLRTDRNRSTWRAITARWRELLQGLLAPILLLLPPIGAVFIGSLGNSHSLSPAAGVAAAILLQLGAFALAGPSLRQCRFAPEAA